MTEQIHNQIDNTVTMTSATGRRPTIVDPLPKAELHLHLEGAIRPHTAVALAARHGTRVTVDEVMARYRYSDFAGFIETFKWITSFLREPADFALITRELLDELIRQNVVYAEIIVSVGVMLLRNQDVESLYKAIYETSVDSRYQQIHTAFLFDAVRQFGPQPAMEVAQWAAEFQSRGVVGFGMGGNEISIPTEEFRAPFDYARNEGLRIVCHAGEIGGPAYIREAVEMLGAERIGHGIAVMHDPALAEFLAMRRIVLENCPTSNLCTGALAAQLKKPQATMQEHPLPKFLDAGLAVTLSTDDPALFHTDLCSEYSHVSAMGVSERQLLQLLEQSFQSAFLAPADKRHYLDDFRAAVKSAGLL